MSTGVNRRRFVGSMTGAAAAAASSLGKIRAAEAAVEKVRPPGALGPIKQIDAGLLNVGYAEMGPAGGTAAILLHGWPYDIHSYAEVAPALASAGYRVVVPFLRGFGATRFLSSDTSRNGQQSAVGLDVVEMMNALHIDKAIIAGFDWGARTADVVAALWPQRCKGIVSVSGYLVTNLEANQKPLPPAAELGWWYQYYFATDRGRRGYAENRRDFNKLIWKLASPKWNFDDATYERTAASFDNPDHVDIVIHNYRWRLGLAKGEPRCDELERKLSEAPAIGVPAITIGSDFDGAAADGMGYAKKFTGKYAHRVLRGIGHNVPQEAPRAFAQAVQDVDRFAG
jgi:pimeloyl-ACP methyl ester carboxylesterase